MSESDNHVIGRLDDGGARARRSTRADHAEGSRGPPIGALPLLSREAELEHLSRLDPGGGVVCLVGAAGVGKTRLLLEHIARTPRAATIFADLSAARSDDDVVDAITRAAAATAQGARHARTAKLRELLSARPDTLLAIDNAEHVVDAVRALLVELTAVLDHVFVVVTSRRPLSMTIERVLEVPSLSTAEADPAAARHFVNALRHRAPATPELTPIELTRVKAIAELVDGNPLAIELCAARATLLGLAAIHDALHESIIEAARNDERGRRFSSLREAIMWSWRLLAEGEQRALARLSVFPLYFDLRSAAPVLGLSRADAARSIELLRSASLLSSSPHPSSPDRLRFRMTVAVRELAAQDLGEADRASAELAHREAILRAAEERLARDEALLFDGDGDNELTADLRVIIDRARAANDVVSMTRAVLSLGPSLVRYGAGEDSWQIVQQAWSSIDRAARPDLAAQVALLAQLLQQRESLPAARTWAERAVEAAERADDAGLVFRARCFLAWLHAAEPDFPQARALLGDETTWPALSAPARALGHAALAFIELGEGRPAEALRRLRATAAQSEAAGHAHGFVMALLVLAHARSGDLEGAVRSGTAALASGVLASDDRVYTVSWLALALGLLGDREAAGRLIEDGLVEARANGEVRPVCWVLRTRGYLRAAGVVEGDAEDDLRRAIALSGATDAPFRAAALLALSCAVSSREEAATLLEQGIALTERAAPAHLDAIPLRRAHVALRAASAEDRARCVDEARRVLDQVPPEAGSATGIARLALERELAAARPREAAAFAADGSWFRVGSDAVVDLSRSSTLRAVLRALVEHYPGAGLDTARLFERAWSGEQARPSAARARVYTAVRRLRELGLRDVLIRRSGGFALDPRQALAVGAPRAVR